MRRAARAAAWIGLALWAAAGPALAARAVPFLSGRVVDEAGMIPPPARDRIELRLRDLEQATGAQVAVLTVPGLEGEVLEEYTLRVAETWKLGGAERDDGVLLFVSRGDRKMRLEVGYGLEDRLTDLRSRRILDEVIGPRFKAGDFGGGLEAGVRAIDTAVRGGEVAAELPAVAPVGSAGSGGEAAPPDWLGRLCFATMFVGVVGTFSTIALLGRGGLSWVLYLFLIPFHCAFPMVILTPAGGLVWLAVWVVGFPVARLVLGRTAWGRDLREKFPEMNLSAVSWASSGGSDSSGGGSWSFSSGGSSGGSSFSGGGGSFGGGGASSSW